MAGWCLLLAVGHAIAQVPAPFDGLPFQGFLADANGEALGKSAPANYDVVFRIYDSSSGGNLLWTEQQTVTVDAGYFSVELGMGGALEGQPKPSLPSLFRSPSASERHVESVLKGIGPGGSDHVIQPRARLYPLPYAFVASHASTAGSLLAGADASALAIVGSRVGINTTDPQATLDVAGSLAATDAEVTGDLVVEGTVTADAWAGGGTVPVGTVILWSGSVVPADWAVCNGQMAQGVQTPDLRGRFILGAGQGQGLVERRIGDRGGTESSVITPEETPAHGHGIAPQSSVLTSESGAHRHSYVSELQLAPGGTGDALGWLRSMQNSIGIISGTHRSSKDGSHTHVLDVPPSNTSLQGSGASQSHLPPFYVLAYIMRVR